MSHSAKPADKPTRVRIRLNRGQQIGPLIGDAPPFVEKSDAARTSSFIVACMNNTNQGGFTLYELMVTVAIVGVVLAFGVPNMRQFNQNAKMTSTANDLHAAFHLARSEATRAKTNITLCASSDSTTANPTCTGTWDQGYIVFVDSDGDIQRAGATETVLRAQQAIEDGVTLVAENDSDYFSFAATGLGRGVVNGDAKVLSRIVMCDDRGNVPAAGGNSAARVFVATPLGRATIQRNIPLIQGVLDDLGETCP